MTTKHPKHQKRPAAPPRKPVLRLPFPVPIRLPLPLGAPQPVPVPVPVRSPRRSRLPTTPCIDGAVRRPRIEPGERDSRGARP